VILLYIVRDASSRHHRLRPIPPAHPTAMEPHYIRLQIPRRAVQWTLHTACTASSGGLHSQRHHEPIGWTGHRPMDLLVQNPASLASVHLLQTVSGASPAEVYSCLRYNSLRPIQRVGERAVRTAGASASHDKATLRGSLHNVPKASSVGTSATAAFDLLVKPISSVRSAERLPARRWTLCAIVDDVVRSLCWAKRECWCRGINVCCQLQGSAME